MTTDNQGVSREECESFLGDFVGRAREIDIFLKRLARAHIALLDSSEKDKADAVAAERERCAKIAEVHAGQPWADSHQYHHGSVIANSIRSGK